MQRQAKIDKTWWEFLAPKPMVRHRLDIENLLNSFINSSDYGKEWFKVARIPNGVFRLKPGQIIPVIQLTFFNNHSSFITPFRKLEEEHRTVEVASEYQSGRSLGESERAIQPLISIDFVTDPLLIKAASQAKTVIDEKLIRKPSLIFTIPAHFLFSPKHFPKKAYVLYQHIFGNGSSYPNDGFFYVGITTRSWQKRWSEHRRAIKNDSPLLFHRKFREEMGNGRVTYINHKIMGITNDLEKLYDTEEFLVEGHWEDKRRLNMIPGGKSGLRYLRENGLIKSSSIPKPDERNNIVRDWINTHPRKGLPTPWVTEKWRDNDWATAQICSRDDRLSIEQVRAIRNLAKNHSAEEICTRIGAKDIAQVKRVIEGKTYTRVS